MRKEKQYHFIYKTTNLLSGKYYIGMHSTDNLEDGYLGSGKRLRYSLNKYGKENHKREILQFCKSRKELKSREEEIVNLNEIAKKDCINLKIGGSGGFSNEHHKILFEKGRDWGKILGGITTGNILRGIKLSDKRKIEISNKLIEYYLNNINPFKGCKHTEETKRKIGLKSSIHQKGKNNSQYGTCWITNGSINKKIKKENILPNGFKLGRKKNK